MACQERIILINASTITSTSVSTAYAVPAKFLRWAGLISVTTITGTAPTLDVTLQHSGDGTNWVTLLAFTQLGSGSANSTAHLFAAAATDYLKPILPYVRASYVVGGSASPTFNGVSVSFLLSI